MKYSFSAIPVHTLATDAVIVFATQFDDIAKCDLTSLDKLTGRAISVLLESGDFSGKDGEVSQLILPSGCKAKKVILAGLGTKEKLTPDSFRRAMGSVAKLRVIQGVGKAAVHFMNFTNPAYFQATIEGWLLGSYKFLEYKSGEGQDNKLKLAALTFAVNREAAVGKLKSAIERGTIIAEGQILVRNLSGTPANFLTPRIYVEKTTKLARQYKLSLEVLDEKRIAAEKMGGLLSVAKGSVEPPRFMILKYNGAAASQKPIVLVGKGVTFDAGGISIKPAQDMHEMKQDMTGSAVMIATIITAARLRLPLNLVTLTPLTENLPSGHATRPGDIITMRTGKTVEIINTDAEGRLILADALDYANKYKPQAVIDIATLTGAAIYILGYAGAPILGNSDELLGRIKKAADVTAEKVWQLPIWDEHRDQMKSNIADLVNSGGRAAGTIAATAFLENFIGEYPWAHIDIAWMDMEHSGKPYSPKGATGFGVRLLTEMLSNWKKMK